MTPTPNQTNAPRSAEASVSSQSGQVKPQNKKSRRTLSVFWSMKMSSNPTPVSEAMAPAPSPRAWASEPLFVGLSRMATPPSRCVTAEPDSTPAIPGGGERRPAASVDEPKFEHPDRLRLVRFRPDISPCRPDPNSWSSGMNEEARHQLRPTKRIADALVALLLTQILLLGAEALALVDRIRIVERVRAGRSVTLADVEHADTLVMASLVAWVVLFAVTGIVWCVWQHRAQRNAIELAYGKLQFTPGWAVGWWFVPFANLVKPFQTVRELWKASHGGYDGRIVGT